MYDWIKALATVPDHFSKDFLGFVRVSNKNVTGAILITMDKV